MHTIIGNPVTHNDKSPLTQMVKQIELVSSLKMYDNIK